MVHVCYPRAAPQEFTTLFDDIPDADISVKGLAERWIGFLSTVQARAD